MPANKRNPMTFDSAVNSFKPGKLSARLYSNTVIKYSNSVNDVGPESIDVLLCDNRIMSIGTKSIRLFHGGRFKQQCVSFTTQRRMNELLPNGWKVYNDCGEQFVEGPDGTVYDFEDGMSIAL